MTTYDYYSIPLRMGVLILVLSCAAIANVTMNLSDVMAANTFKCVLAMWTLLGLVGIDISKNGIRQWRRQVRQIECLTQSSRFKPEVISGDTYGVIDPRGHIDR